MNEIDILGVCPNCGEGIIEIEVDGNIGHLCPICNWSGAPSEIKLPNIKAKTIKKRDGIWDIYVPCPFCGKEHHHGGGIGETPNLGSRLSHCSENAREYFLI